MRRYYQVQTYGELKRLGGVPLSQTRICALCGKTIRLGETDLHVEAVSEPPFPDALGVLFGPEWLASESLREIIGDFSEEQDVSYAAVKVDRAELDGYQQVILSRRLRVGAESFLGGNRCVACGGDVQLRTDRLYLALPTTFPPLALLSESVGIVLLREDVVAEVKSNSLDVDFLSTLYEGEVAARPQGRFTGESWSDVS
jgi:hypothetical protein